MPRLPRTTRSLALIALVFTMLAAVPASTLAKPGNSGAAKMCEENGYLGYQDGNGKPFRNAGQCMRYAAQGGTLVPLIRTVTLTWMPGPSGCGAEVVVTGFPNGSYEGTFEADGFERAYPFSVEVSGGTGTAGVPHDGMGYGIGLPFSHYAAWTVTVGGMSDTEPYACP